MELCGDHKCKGRVKLVRKEGDKLIYKCAECEKVLTISEGQDLIEEMGWMGH